MMFNKIAILGTWLTLTLVCWSCNGYENFPTPPYPRVRTLSVMEVSARGATLEAEITSAGDTPITDHGFIWGLDENLNLINSTEISLGTLTNPVRFTARIDGILRADTVYFMRSYVRSASYITYGDKLQIRVKP